MTDSHTTTPATERAHALYRFYSHGGQLLYVGITNNPGNRFTQHQADKPWWHEVAGISVEKHDTRAEALAAETRAIAIESPLYNVQRPSIGKKRATHARARVGLVWICDACRKPVGDGTGYVHIDERAVYLAEQQTAAVKKHVAERNGSGLPCIWTGADLLNLPEDVPWHVHHATCDPEPDASSYWFGVERARTHAHLLNWTAHLMQKAWLEHTDWHQLIDRMAGVDA